MDKDEQLIDNLLKEHAKHGGVDEQFITEVEEKITEAERSNIIDLNRNESSSQKDWKKGVGIGVAACAAICVAGTIMWQKENRSQTVVLDSGSATSQIEIAHEELQEMKAGEGALKGNVEAKSKKKELASPNITDSVRREQNEIAGGKRQIEKLTIPNAAQVPSVDFSDSASFGHDFAKDKVLQPSLAREVEKNPSAPSASMPKVRSSVSPSREHIPVPDSVGDPFSDDSRARRNSGLNTTLSDDPFAGRAESKDFNLYYRQSKKFSDEKYDDLLHRLMMRVSALPLPSMLIRLLMRILAE